MGITVPISLVDAVFNYQAFHCQKKPLNTSDSIGDP